MFTYGIHNIEESYGSSTPQEVIFGSEPNKTFSPIDDPYQLSTPFGVKAVPQKARDTSKASGGHIVTRQTLAATSTKSLIG